MLYAMGSTRRLQNPQKQSDQHHTRAVTSYSEHENESYALLSVSIVFLLLSGTKSKRDSERLGRLLTSFAVSQKASKTASNSIKSKGLLLLSLRRFRVFPVY